MLHMSTRHKYSSSLHGKLCHSFRTHRRDFSCTLVERQFQAYRQDVTFCSTLSWNIFRDSGSILLLFLTRSEESVWDERECHDCLRPWFHLPLLLLVMCYEASSLFCCHYQNLISIEPDPPDQMVASQDLDSPRWKANSVSRNIL